MKKTTKDILNVALPVAMLLSSGWTANATVSKTTEEQNVSVEKTREDLSIVENCAEDSQVLQALYACRNSCMGSCGGSCYGSCERSCMGSCTAGCSSSCSGSCKFSSARTW
ncbi:MAG: hypothetical protein KBT11_02405 [Treponema sp.]|nr:hypothetical protein [Candidatus Treponema equifaecale]